jgi:hypothetical protein
VTVAEALLLARTADRLSRLRGVMEEIAKDLANGGYDLDEWWIVHAGINDAIADLEPLRDIAHDPAP